jgi:hypothetical protein
MSRQAIRTHATALKVPFLMHFTRATNLPSIMLHGLYAMAHIAMIGANPQIYVELRLDGHLDGTSLSIGFPNHRMFYKYRQENAGVEWAVLAIDASVLWSKDCAFCRYNAADARISGQPMEVLKTVDTFIGMFDEIEGHTPRQEQRLRTYDPTDSQAEVMVFDVIEPNLIRGIAFDSENVKKAYGAHLGTREVMVVRPNKSYFAARSYVR